MRALLKLVMFLHIGLKKMHESVCDMLNLHVKMNEQSESLNESLQGKRKKKLVYADSCLTAHHKE